MAFGQGFQPVETIPPLEDGEYKARIKNVQIFNYQSTMKQYCKVELEIQGHPGTQPNTIILNETPILGEYKANGEQVTQKDINIANGLQTKFFDAFNIPRGNFNLTSWVGAIGWVKCSPQKNRPEFKQLNPIIKKEDKKQSSPAPTVPPTVQKIVNAMGKQNVESVQAQPITNLNNFPEDVNF